MTYGASEPTHRRTNRLTNDDVRRRRQRAFAAGGGRPAFDLLEVFVFAFPTTARSDNMLENFDLHDQIAVKTKEIRDEVGGPDVAHPHPDLFTITTARE